MMTEIRSLESLDLEDFRQVMTGYRTSRQFNVERAETHDQTTITLRLIALDRPYVKNFPQPLEEMERYQRIVKQGTLLGPYDGGLLVGPAIAERRDWNRSLWVWDSGVAEEGWEWGQSLLRH